MENTRQNTEIYPSKSLSLNYVQNGAKGFRSTHMHVFTVKRLSIGDVAKRCCLYNIMSDGILTNHQQRYKVMLSNPSTVYEALVVVHCTCSILIEIFSIAE